MAIALNCCLSLAVFLLLVRVLVLTAGDQATRRTQSVKGGSYLISWDTPLEHRHQEEDIASVNIVLIFPV